MIKTAEEARAWGAKNFEQRMKKAEKARKWRAAHKSEAALQKKRYRDKIKQSHVVMPKHHREVRHPFQAFLDNLKLTTKRYAVVGVRSKTAQNVVAVEAHDPEALLQKLHDNVESARELCGVAADLWKLDRDLQTEIRRMLKRTEYDKVRKLLYFPHVIFNAQGVFAKFGDSDIND
jgi:hypothetical protein